MLYFKFEFILFVFNILFFFYIWVHHKISKAWTRQKEPFFQNLLPQLIYSLEETSGKLGKLRGDNWLVIVGVLVGTRHFAQLEEIIWIILFTMDPLLNCAVYFHIYIILSSTLFLGCYCSTLRISGNSKLPVFVCFFFFYPQVI